MKKIIVFILLSIILIATPLSSLESKDFFELPEEEQKIYVLGVIHGTQALVYSFSSQLDKVFPEACKYLESGYYKGDFPTMISALEAYYKAGNTEEVSWVVFNIILIHNDLLRKEGGTNGSKIPKGAVKPFYS